MKTHALLAVAAVIGITALYTFTQFAQMNQYIDEVASQASETLLANPRLDVCPNIAGIQMTVPLGMVRDRNGNCVRSLSIDQPIVLQPTAACDIALTPPASINYSSATDPVVQWKVAKNCAVWFEDFASPYKSINRTDPYTTDQTFAYYQQTLSRAGRPISYDKTYGITVYASNGTTVSSASANVPVVTTAAPDMKECVVSNVSVTPNPVVRIQKSITVSWNSTNCTNITVYEYKPYAQQEVYNLPIARQVKYSSTANGSVTFPFSGGEAIYHVVADNYNNATMKTNSPYYSTSVWSEELRVR